MHDEALAAILDELHRDGREHDAGKADRLDRLRNLEPDTARVLSLLVRALRPSHVLELGTSNGYSTLWLADAAREINGSVVTAESAEFKIGLASANFARAGLSPYVTLVHGDAVRLLEHTEPSAYDLIFLDSDRAEYPGWWPHVRRALRPGGLLVADNATSHIEEMAPLIALVTADPDFTTCLVPVGNGEFLAVKNSS